MSDVTDPQSTDSADYDVVLLVEQALTDADAQQVRSLHEGLDEPVTYHVLLPVEDAAAAVEAAMGSMSGPRAGPRCRGSAMPEVDLEAIVKDSRERAERAARGHPRRAPGGRRHGHRRARRATRSTRWPPRSPRSTAARRSS